VSSKKRFLGRKARLYRNNDGTWADPTWARIETRNTLSVSLGKTMEDVTAEDSDGEKWEQAVLNERGLEFEMFFEEDAGSDTNFTSLQTAYENDAAVIVAVAYGDITGNGIRYRKMELYVTEFNETLDAAGAGKVKVTLTPGPTENKPVTLTTPAE
jgi:hypothetical protein